VGEVGGVELPELEKTFNQGVGMIAVVEGDAADDVVRLLDDRGVPAWVCGTVGVRDGDEAVTLVGSHSA
jgi:phosphoribosylformylglycinamidine cyclo-ligase